MANANIKYLTDENENIVSPVTSSKSVFLTDNTALQDKINSVDNNISTINSKLINATTSAAGFMSATDKTKLDGIATGADSVSISRDLTSGTKVGTITINGTGTDLYAPTPPSKGVIITQVKSYTSNELSTHDTNYNSASFSATGPGSGWYPTCVTVPVASGTTTLGAGIFSQGITMTTVGDNTCGGKIYFSGNSGNASTNRGKCTYYVIWAKIS